MYREADGARQGECDIDKQKIVIAEGELGPDLLAVTLMHEILHVAIETGLQNGDPELTDAIEEKFVSALAPQARADPARQPQDVVARDHPRVRSPLVVAPDVAHAVVGGLRVRQRGHTPFVASGVAVHVAHRDVEFTLKCRAASHRLIRS